MSYSQQKIVFPEEMFSISNLQLICMLSSGGGFLNVWFLLPIPLTSQNRRGLMKLDG